MIHFFLKYIFLVLSSITLSVNARDSDCSKSNTCERLVKLNSASALGECLDPKDPKDIAALFARHNIQVYEGTIPKKRGSVKDPKLIEDYSDQRVLAVAKVVAAYEGIGNGKMDALKKSGPIKIIFDNGKSVSKTSRRFEDEIQLRAGSDNINGMLGQSEHNGVDNIGLIAHELGHYIGGCNDGENYKKYDEYMGGMHCKVSNYASKKPEEEFAEVIAAYLTIPQAFKDKGKECDKAFSFMRVLFGESTDISTKMSATELCKYRQVSYSIDKFSVTRFSELEKKSEYPKEFHQKTIKNPYFYKNHKKIKPEISSSSGAL